MTSFQVAVPLQMSLGESPLWDHRHQRLHWIDIHAGLIYAWQPEAGGTPQSVQLSEQIGCLALAGSGGLLAATASGIALLDKTLQPQRILADNPQWQDGAGNRFNDGAVDPLNRLWVGTLDRQETNPSAALYCLAGTALSQEKTALVISNGLAFSPQGDWLYHTDSPQRKVMRHRVDLMTGIIGGAEPWIDLDRWGLPGVVDGATVDSLGRYWCALYGGGQVACFSPSGEHLKSYPLPCPHPTMVTFGGNDLKTLFVTTARQHLQPEQLSCYPDAGSVLSMSVDVAGLAQHVFADLPS
ncbi:UNVERIFIED_ORG: sugar lactone lactonase YvrE [Pseudomonas lini]